MKFSIVIPTYNEESDIADTIDCLLKLDWPDVEIIIVDDSTDQTPNIINSFKRKNICLIRPEKRKGRCEARNLGILEASGDIVVLLNADVHLPEKFLIQIALSYEQNYDYVLVRSRVENMESLFARYVECSGAVNHYNKFPERMEWTEGFSCRRDIAIRAGLFPTNYPVPIVAGEDAFFGERLKSLGGRKKIDLDILVTHIAPSSFREYWQIRVGRGRGSPQIRRFINKWSFDKIICWASLRLIRTILITITLLPLFLICQKVAKESHRRKADILPFCWAWVIEQAAFHVGEWYSIIEIYKAEISSEEV